MNRDGHKNVKFFIGPEVEHTPAFSKKTLFVVGKQPIREIEALAREHKTPHIFMGANHSFNVASKDPYWDQTITALLDRGFWVTLDYQAHEHEDVLNMLNPGIWQCRTFVPLLGVRIPKIQSSSPNLTVKIDDIDFKATNPGVWCLHYHEVTDSNRFTDWIEYGSDEIIETSNDVKETPPAKVEVPPVVNLADIGLDPYSPSQLKSEPVDEAKVLSTIIDNPTDAAEAYADGATADPLSDKTPIKKVKAKAK